jgi:hypothetical protein
MRTAISLVIALLCAGCQTRPTFDPGPPDNAPPCKGRGTGANTEACMIRVKVSESDAGCTVDVADAQALVDFASGRQNIWVVWKLDPVPEGYRFLSDDGIAFKQDPLKNFKAGQPIGEKGDGFAVINTNSRLWGVGDYRYGVHVENPTKRMRCDHDPWFRNN